MRRLKNPLILTLALIAFLAGCSSGGEKILPKTVSAESFGADGTDTEDDRHCIQLALNYARDNASESSPVTVTLGDGIYYIDNGLTVHSHTRFILSKNAVIVFTGQAGCMVYCGSESGNGYDSVTDVAISGGRWRGNASVSGVKTQLFGFKRANAITLRDISMEDSSDHFIMLTGVSDATVTGCSFKDYVPISDIDQFTKEALHIDFLPLGNNRFFPSQNITVESCRFDNVASGIGTHHYGYGSYEKNIAVRECIFEKVQYNCVNAYSMTGLSVTDCTAHNCGAFLWSRATGSSVLYNSISGTGERCISILDGSTAMIKSNTVTNVCGSSADGKSIALLAGESSCVIDGNDISHVDGTGIRLRGNSSLSTVRGNTVAHLLGQGIFLSGAKACIEGNTLEDCQGIWTDSSESSIVSNTVNGCLYGIACHSGSSLINGNAVSDPKSAGIKITGTEENPGSAVIENNTITGASEPEVKIGRSCTGCIVRSNNPRQGFNLACSVHSDVTAFRNGQSPLPDAPSVGCSVVGDTAHLSWPKAEGAADYVIYSYDSAADSLVKLAVTRSRSYDITGLAPDTENYFLVAGRDAKGRQSVCTYPSCLVDACTGIYARSASVLYSGGDRTVREGEAACFSVRAEGSGLGFRWQIRDSDSLDWHDWKGKTSPFISAVAESSWDGAAVRCAVTDSAGSTVYSEPTVIRLRGSAEITMQTADARAYNGGPVSFSVAISGEYAGCRWYFRKPGSQVWARWKGQESTSVFTSAGEIPDGAQVKCVVICLDGGETVSAPMSVTVITPLRIVSDLHDVYAEEGETVTFEIKAESSDALYYQWYYRKSGDSEWHMWTGHTSSSVTAAANATWQGMKVKCVVTDITGDSVESREAAVTLRE